MIRFLQARLRRFGVLAALLAIVGLGTLHGAHTSPRPAPHAAAAAHAGDGHFRMAAHHGGADKAAPGAAHDADSALCCATPPVALPAPLRDLRTRSVHRLARATVSGVAHAPQPPPPRGL